MKPRPSPNKAIHPIGSASDGRLGHPAAYQNNLNLGNDADDEAESVIKAEYVHKTDVRKKELQTDISVGLF